MTQQSHAEELFLRFFQDPERIARRFAGQLNPEFQVLAAQSHSGVTPEKCHFYHTVDLGGGHTVEGAWDLRAGVRDYLGHLEYEGQRVLEFGPATGYLGFTMESWGAQVTAFDIAPYLAQDLVPLPGQDLEAHQRNSVSFSRQVRNAWWFCRESSGATVRPVSGDIVHLPEDIGRYDVSTFGSILLHLGNPFAALRQAAAVTGKAIVVTDMVQRMPVCLKNSFMEFNPGEMPDNLVNWWWVTPGATMKMLKVLGFPAQRVFFHEQKLRPHHDMTQPQLDIALYTVVGQRAEGLVPQRPLTPQEEARQSELRECMVVDLDLHELAVQNRLLRLELKTLNESTSMRVTRPFRAVGDYLRKHL